MLDFRRSLISGVNAGSFPETAAGNRAYIQIGDLFTSVYFEVPQQQRGSLQMCCTVGYMFCKTDASTKFPPRRNDLSEELFIYILMEIQMTQG